MLDIFENDAFSVTNLTDAINLLQFKPGRIREMRLFQPSSVNSLSVAIEMKDNALKLVAPSPRGGPGETRGKRNRNLRNLNIPHFEIDDAIMADEVQGVRAFGSETELEQILDKVNERNAEHNDDMDVTEEHARLGAVKGVVTYADGSTLDLFNEFGVTQIPTKALNIANSIDGTLREKCSAISREVAAELGGSPYSGLHAFCGDNFFDDLLKNKEVRETYIGWSEAKILREGYVSPDGKVYSAFEFGGIVWENYRGNDSVGGTFVATDEAHIFPTGVPRLFRTYYGPADYVETVNTRGKRLYAKIYQMKNGKGVHLDVQMNALSICTRPRTLIHASRSA